MGVQQSMTKREARAGDRARTLSSVHSSRDGKGAAALQQRSDSPQSAPFPILSLPDHLISSHVLPHVSNPASVRSFLISCKATHSLDSMSLRVKTCCDWLERQQPARAVRIGICSAYKSEALLQELLNRPGVLAGLASSDKTRARALYDAASARGGAVCSAFWDAERCQGFPFEMLDGVCRIAVRKNMLRGPDAASAGGRCGITLLMAAAIAGDALVVDEVLQAGGDESIAQADKNGSTALHYAAVSPHVHVMHQLLQVAGAPVNACKKDGHAPLHWACHVNRADNVRKLLQHPETNTTLRNASGATPLDVARREGHGEVVALLEHAARA